MTPKINIVIPSFNHYDLTNTLLWNLYQKEYENIDYVLIVDDASTDEVVDDGLKWWEFNDMLPLTKISNSVNRGFLKTSNMGLKSVSRLDTTEPDDIIILISNDVQVNGRFIQQIKDILVENPKTLVGNRLLDYDTGWNTFDDKVFPYLEGWFLATTVENWNELGYFDERYSPCDMEDIHLSTKALSIGMKLVSLDSSSLYHLGAQTIKYGEKRMEQTLKNKEVFRKIWVQG